MDLIEEKVIIQRDVEHILVKLTLQPTLDNLNTIGKSIFLAKRALASNTLDSGTDSNLKPFFEQLDFLAQQTEIRRKAITGVFVINQQETLNSRKTYFFTSNITFGQSSRIFSELRSEFCHWSVEESMLRSPAVCKPG